MALPHESGWNLMSAGHQAPFSIFTTIEPGIYLDKKGTFCLQHIKTRSGEKSSIAITADLFLICCSEGPTPTAKVES